MPKKISVNLSTLVDLKAELFRKQEQANRQKQEKKQDQAASTSSSKSASSLYVKGTKPLLHDARKAAAAEAKLRLSSDQRRKNDASEAASREEERQLARSRERLEEKAKLYEKLQKGNSDAGVDDAALYLVNFERKAFHDRQESDDEDEEDDDNPSTSRKVEAEDDEQDWVEYTDVLGRTRKCLRQDLPSFVAADEKLKKRRAEPVDAQQRNDDVDGNSELLSEDMRRELKRKAWEREEQEQAAAVRGPVHYQHVSQGESRELGVGYFAFATDEQTRKEQMLLLDELRNQTVSQRERSQKVKEKREAALKARLDKVKERKKLKLTDNDAGFGDEDSEEDELRLTRSTEALEDIPLPPPSSLETPKAQDAPKADHVRPWDIGKSRVSHEHWVDKQRQERTNEFAPPSFYK